MNKKRALEIASSPIMANVTYNGVSVYIDRVNEDNGIAYIYPLDHPEKIEQVSITNLEER